MIAATQTQLLVLWRNHQNLASLKIFTKFFSDMADKELTESFKTIIGRLG